MASFEDYDEFGNYIGADLDSDEEDEVPQNAFTRETQAPLEGFDDEPMAQDEDALMEVEGVLQHIPARNITNGSFWHRAHS